MIKIIKGQIFFYFLAALIGAAVILLINKYLNDSKTLNILQAKEGNVLENVKIIEYEDDAKYTYIHLVGEKIRSDCGAPIKLSGFYGDPLTPFDVVDLKKNVIDEDSVTKKFIERPSIPGELQDFGWWALTPNPNGKFYLYVEYLCGQSSDIEATPYVKKNIIGPLFLKK